MVVRAVGLAHHTSSAICVHPQLAKIAAQHPRSHNQQAIAAGAIAAAAVACCRCRHDALHPALGNHKSMRSPDRDPLCNVTLRPPGRQESGAGGRAKGRRGRCCCLSATAASPDVHVFFRQCFEKARSTVAMRRPLLSMIMMASALLVPARHAASAAHEGPKGGVQIDVLCIWMVQYPC